MKLRHVLYGSALAAGVVTGNSLAQINEVVAKCSLVDFNELETNFESVPEGEATVICSANYPNCDTGTALAWYSNGGNMEWVEREQMGQYFETAMLDAENHRFYYERTIEAPEVLAKIALRAEVDISALSVELPSGASTVAMQLARNEFPDAMPEDTVCRKFTEIAIGQHLLDTYAGEPVYVTDPATGQQVATYPGLGELFEVFANNINYGRGAWGPQAASQAFFGKNIWETNIIESATLAGTINAPSAMDGLPDNDNPNDNEAEVQNEMTKLQERRDVVLEDIIRVHPELKDEIIAGLATQPSVYDYVLQGQRYSQSEEESTTRAEELGAMHYMMRVKNSVMETLGLSEEQFRDGLIINTTLNEDIQKNILEAVNNVGWPRDGRQIAVVALAQDGRVLGMYGGDWSQSQVNLATRPGPVGSSLKPYYYAWGLQNGLIVPNHEFVNVPLDFTVPDGNNQPYIVDEGAHCPNPASCTLQQAIGYSDNVVPLQMVYNAETAGTAALQGTSDLMHGFGMYGESPVVLSNVLGSWETSAYSLATGMNGLINNQGTSRPSFSIIGVFQEKDGQIVQIDEGKFQPAAGVQLISPENSQAIREGMWKTVTEGTASRVLGGTALSAACKTGSAPNGMSAAITCVTDTESGPITYAVVMRHVVDLSDMGDGSNGGQIPAQIYLEAVR